MLRARTAQVAETQKIEASDMEEEAKALARYQLVLKEVRRARARALVCARAGGRTRARVPQGTGSGGRTGPAGRHMCTRICSCAFIILHNAQREYATARL